MKFYTLKFMYSLKQQRSKSLYVESYLLLFFDTLSYWSWDYSEQWKFCIEFLNQMQKYKECILIIISFRATI